MQPSPRARFAQGKENASNEKAKIDDSVEKQWADEKLANRSVSIPCLRPRSRLRPVRTPQGSRMTTWFFVSPPRTSSSPINHSFSHTKGLLSSLGHNVVQIDRFSRTDLQVPGDRS